MPYARYQKLDADRRHNIMESAAQVFAEHGYHGASMNQILKQAGLSKGVAYYYFEDKADLFATTIEYYLEQIDLNIRDKKATLNEDNFWELLLELYAAPFLDNLDAPYRFQVLKVATKIAEDDPVYPRILKSLQIAFGWTMEVLQKGQALGMVRTDIPNELLYGFMSAIDEVTDNYLLENLDTLNKDGIYAIQAHTIDAIKRLVSP